jgi:hypothetical protein
MAREELKRLHWDAAALKTIEVYQDVSREDPATWR